MAHDMAEVSKPGNATWVSSSFLPYWHTLCHIVLHKILEKIEILENIFYYIIIPPTTSMDGW
jgi:hypothetical protein